MKLFTILIASFGIAGFAHASASLNGRTMTCEKQYMPQNFTETFQYTFFRGPAGQDLAQLQYVGDSRIYIIPYSVTASELNIGTPGYEITYDILNPARILLHTESDIVSGYPTGGGNLTHVITDTACVLN